MTNISKLIDDVIDREGGYSNHPADTGGETMYGITIKVAREQGYTGPMRSLSRAEAAQIYKRLYWLRPRFGEVGDRMPALAAELFDTGINMGTGTAARFLQRALNALNRGASDYPDIAVDGTIGGQTLAALDKFVARRGRAGEKVLVKAVEALQGERYLSLAERRPANEAFVYGWLSTRIGQEGS